MTLPAIVTLDEYEREVCARASFLPTPATLSVMTEWGRLEGLFHPDGLHLERGWNIWMTTLKDEARFPRNLRDRGGPQYEWGAWNRANGTGVGIYASPDAGVDATVASILDERYYHAIPKMFRTSQYVEGVREEFQTWIGKPEYSDNLAAFAKRAYDAQGAAVTAAPEDFRTIAGETFDKNFGPYFLVFMEMLFGLREPTWGTEEAPRAQAVREMMLSMARGGSSPRQAMNEVAKILDQAAKATFHAAQALS